MDIDSNPSSKLNDPTAENIDNFFQEDLESLPEVLTYIKRLQDIILRQRKIILKFYSERKPKTDAWTQTDLCEKQNGNELKDEEKDEHPVLESKPVPDKWSTDSKEVGGSILEQVAQAAESAMKQTGFVYEETSGMYYDYNTGYYYNAELGLYYDGNTGTYYYYDEPRKTFHFHSRVEASVPVKPKEEVSSQQRSSESETDKEKFGEESVKTKRKSSENEDADEKAEENSTDQQTKRKPCENEDEDRKTKRNKTEEVLEEGECSDSDLESIKSDKGSLEVDDSVENESCDKPLVPKAPVIETADCDSELEISNHWPPCVRVVVQESSVKTLKIGSLFIITWPGGTLGREGDHSILIPDSNVSKYHAKFSFTSEKENEGSYFLVDLGSKNGTYLNGKRLSVALRESDPFMINHGDTVQIGATRLLCHVHNGQETCQDCEPGVTITEDKKKVIPLSKGVDYKSELKRLKHKYGVESLDSTASLPALGYEDKADIRRQKVGSSSENFKTEVASVENSIPSQNKGFKMLSKMGWNKGQALGKQEKSDSITEPIFVFQRPANAGLGSLAGSGSMPVKTLDPKEEKKQELWRKTQQRFKKLK